MRALSIDTSTHRAGVALWADGTCVARETNADPSLHAERIVSLIERALATSGWQRSALDLIVSCVGPGSFTGIRVGLATAKGIALGLDRPIVGVGSLEAMAAAASGTTSGVIVPLLDARKGEIFWAAYAQDGSQVSAPAHVAVANIEQALAPFIERGATVVGEFADSLTLSDAVRRWRSEATDLPDPVYVARVGVTKFERSGPDNLDGLEPVYVRPPDITSPKAG